jgi:glutamate/aspartate transport system permease protein
MLYAFSAFSVNRVMALIEKKTRIPGFMGHGNEVGVAH